jgi:hypothetical protein
MAQPVVTMPLHVTAAGPGAAFVTTNTRVKATTGALGLVSDVIQCSGPLVVGAWVMGNMRVKVSGIPTVGMGSTGTATGAAGATGPVSVTQGDLRVMAS